MYRPILFLDFDGVLHPDPSEKANYFIRVPLIEAVLLEFPSVEIMISSSWRDWHYLTELRKFFPASLWRRIIDVTPRWQSHLFDGDGRHHSRQWECEQWLLHNRTDGTPWIAIDDMNHWLNSIGPKLIYSNPGIGPTEAKAKDLRARLCAISIHRETK